MMAVSGQCSAYETLQMQIGQQCDIYGRLHRREGLGKLPGMYVWSDELEKDIPSDITSSFLRGGIVFTIASFEGYVHNLLDEASDIILDKHSTTGLNQLLTQPEVAKMEKKSADLFARKSALLLKGINDVYTEKLDDISFIDELLSVGRLHRDRQNDKDIDNEEVNEDNSFKYFYQINSKKISAIEFKDRVYLCAMMRLFYGFRCIMCHGSSVRTLASKTGALNYFPYCVDHCEESTKPKLCSDNCQEPFCKLAKIAELNGYINECIKQQERKTIRLYPKPQPLTKITHDKKKEAAQSLRRKYFPELDDEDKFERSTEPLPENYALYHLLRIYTHLKENERGMYITYRVFVRINQFYLALAYQMKIAVGRILMHRYGLPNGTWGVPKGKEELKREIKKFEEDHEQKVIELQKPKPKN